MFKKVETGTVTITEVEDGVDAGGIAAAPYTSSTLSSDGGGSEGKEETASKEDKKPLIGRKIASWREVAIYNKWARLGYVLLLCVILGLILPLLLASFAFPASVNNARGTCALNISYRFDCMPARLSVPSEEDCHNQGCCYDYNSKDLYAPTCFHSIPSEYGYLALNVTTTSGAFRTASIPDGGQSGGVRRVYRLSEAGEITLELAPLMEQTNVGTEAWSLLAKVQYGSSGDVVRVVIYSPEHDDFEDDFPAQSTTPHQLEVTVTQDPGGNFNVTVTRLATGEEILETVFGPMVYGKGFAELTTRLPTSYLYGLGLRRNFDFAPSWSDRSRWPLFTEEKTTMSGNVSVATGNSGAHPFFMNFERTPGYMYGLYLKTSAPLEVGVVPVPAVVFRGVGTLWDLRIMAGPTPSDVSRQYTQMVGRPAMPPYWALGYHLCRAAPQPDFSTYDKVVEGMKEAKIPYESDCIDARLNYPYSFTPLPTEVQQRVAALQGEGKKFTLVQFPFVTYGSGAYNESSQFLLRHNDSSDYYGSIEGLTVGYPDYANENTLPLWLSASADVRSLYGAADGVFLLHNTPLNQAELNYTSWDGTSRSCLPNATESCCPDPALPFLPQGVDDINNHSLCVALIHPSLRGATHLRLHNAYGYYHHRRIRTLMEEIAPKSRPFVTSQSTHLGSGAEGAAFGEGFGANFIEQKVALVQVLELGLYGVPLAGLPICGSRNDTSGDVRSEWCLRGHQMAAFWPLMLSHYEYGHQARNPTDFDKAFSHQLAVFIRMRYTLLPYYYTLLYEASQQGTPVVRPLFYEFPEDLGSRNVSSQFLVGSGLLVSPVLQSVGDEDSVAATLHFPPGRWYNFFSGAVVADGVNSTDGVIPTLLADVNVHVRGGAVVPLQGNLHDWVNTTEDSRAVPFSLIVALCCNSSSSSSSTSSSLGVDENGLWATGSLYLDDGVTPHDLTTDPTAENLQIDATDSQLTVTRATPPGGTSGGLCSSTFTYSTVVNSILVYGVDYSVGTVTVQGASRTTFSQDADTGALTITDVAYDWCAESTLLVTWAP